MTTDQGAKGVAMSKPRSVVKDYAVYLVMRVVVCVLQALSFRAACRLACGLAWLAYRVDRRLSRGGAGQLAARLRRAVRRRGARPPGAGGCTGTSAPLLMEIIHLPRMLHPNNWKRQADHPRLADDDHDDAVGPAGAGGQRPLRQLGDGRLHDGPVRLPQLRHRPPAGQPVRRPLPAAVPRAHRAEGAGQERRPGAECSRCWTARACC